ncbi:MAG: hypothetical protein ABGY11_16510 [Candidatus Thioglobus sp.]
MAVSYRELIDRCFETKIIIDCSGSAFSYLLSNNYADIKKPVSLQAFQNMVGRERLERSTIGIKSPVLYQLFTPFKTFSLA